MREPYPDADGTMIRECKGCAGEYGIRTDEALASAGLVGEGCPWATVDQMADDLFLLSKVIGPSDPHATVTAMRRGHEAAALLSSGSNP